MKSETGARHGGHTCKLTLGRLRQEACHEFQISLCYAARAHVKENQKEGEKGKSLCRQEHRAAREMRARNLCPVMS